MIKRSFLIYNFLGRANDLSDLLPSERFATIAGILQEAGQEVRIRDGANVDTLCSYPPKLIADVEELDLDSLEASPEFTAVLESEAQTVLAGEFDVVLLNFWRGPGFRLSVDLARALKQRRPETEIYAIGQGIDRIRELVLEFAPELDGVIYGLGYESFALLAAGAPREEIPNLIYLQDGEPRFTLQRVVDCVNDLPHEVYDPEVYEGIEGKFPIYPISLSNEACPFQCPFCMRPASYGTVQAVKDAANVVAEVRHLMENYGARYFRIVDSTPPFRALTAFAEAVIAEGLHLQGIHFSSFARLDVNSSDDFELLKRAGVEALFFGIETLDEGNQRRIRKVHPYDNLKDTLRRVHAAGIFAVGSLIFPLPGETEQSMRNTLERLRELKPYLGTVLINPSGVYPNTEWRENPEKYGIEIDEDYDRRWPLYPVKYILPLRHWKPFPFRYGLMGKSAGEVSFADIVELHERFVREIAEDIGISMRVQDYDLVASILMGEHHDQLTGDLVETFVATDYHRLRELVRTARKKNREEAEATASSAAVAE